MGEVRLIGVGGKTFEWLAIWEMEGRDPIAGDRQPSIDQANQSLIRKLGHLYEELCNEVERLEQLRLAEANAHPRRPDGDVTQRIKDAQDVKISRLEREVRALMDTNERQATRIRDYQAAEKARVDVQGDASQYATEAVDKAEGEARAGLYESASAWAQISLAWSAIATQSPPKS